jgi:hypothetical protein
MVSLPGMPGLLADRAALTGEAELSITITCNIKLWTSRNPDSHISASQGRGAFVRPVPRVRLVLAEGSYRKHRGLGVPGFNAQVLEQGHSPEQRLPAT